MHKYLFMNCCVNLHRMLIYSTWLCLVYGDFFQLYAKVEFLFNVQYVVIEDFLLPFWLIAMLFNDIVFWLFFKPVQ